MERVMRIELTTSAWKAEVLPLNYTRNLKGSYLKNQLLHNILYSNGSQDGSEKNVETCLFLVKVLFTGRNWIV
jgi:hypothetical protein